MPGRYRSLSSVERRCSRASARPVEYTAGQLWPLTDREREVFALRARGQSNREIASGLHLSESTIKIHVGHILAKLNLRDRVHAVVQAYETGLITPESQ